MEKPFHYSDAVFAGELVRHPVRCALVGWMDGWMDGESWTSRRRERERERNLLSLRDHGRRRHSGVGVSGTASRIRSHGGFGPDARQLRCRLSLDLCQAFHQPTLLARPRSDFFGVWMVGMGDFLPPPPSNCMRWTLGNGPVKRAHHRDVRTKHVPDPAFEIFALAEAADREDRFDRLLGLLYLVLDQGQDLAHNGLEDVFGLGPRELQAVVFDIRLSRSWTWLYFTTCSQSTLERECGSWHPDSADYCTKKPNRFSESSILTHQNPQRSRSSARPPSHWRTCWVGFCFWSEKYITRKAEADLVRELDGWMNHLDSEHSC